MTDVDPRAEEEEPVGHAVHELTPTELEYVSTGQDVHTADEVAPVMLEYSPATQFTHTAAEVAAVSPEYFPATQLTHALDPVTVLCCPGAHAVHAPPFAPVYPASHTQLVRSPLAAGAREFCGHALQFALPSGDH